MVYVRKAMDVLFSIAVTTSRVHMLFIIIIIMAWSDQP